MLASKSWTSLILAAMLAVTMVRDPQDETTLAAEVVHDPMPQESLVPGLETSSVIAAGSIDSTDPIQVITTNNNYILKINARDPRVNFRTMLANSDVGGRQPLARMKTRIENQGYAGWAVINGDLYSNGCAASSGVNCAEGLTYISGQRKDNYAAYGGTWQGRGNFGVDESNRVQISRGDVQTKRYMTIAGGPRLVMAGGAPTCQAEYNTASSIAHCGPNKTYFPASDECFDEGAASWCTDDRAQSVLGYSQDGQYVFMGISKGGKLVTELAQQLKDQGAHEVLRLDSGGSSIMYHNGAQIKGVGTEVDCYIANAFAVTVDVAPPTGIWHVRYFANQDCQTPTCTTTPSCEMDLTGGLDMRWDNGQPTCLSSSDGWSALFTGRFDFSAGNYVFHVDHDDGVKLWLDGSNILDAWDSTGIHHVCPPSNLAGEHDVALNYRENTGGAHIRLWWDQDPSACTPNRLPYTPSNPYPVDMTVDVSLTPTLYWTGGDPDLGDTVTSAVLFGTDPGSLTSNAAGTNQLWHVPQLLSASTTFYWRVSSTDNHGLTANGPLWQFTTRAPITTCVIPGDANSDGRVDGVDYVIWLNNFGRKNATSCRDGDYNGDGVVDGVDYVVWLNHFRWP